MLQRSLGCNLPSRHVAGPSDKVAACSYVGRAQSPTRQQSHQEAGFSGRCDHPLDIIFLRRSILTNAASKSSSPGEQPNIGEPQSTGSKRSQMPHKGATKRVPDSSRSLLTPSNASKSRGSRATALAKPAAGRRQQQGSTTLAPERAPAHRSSSSSGITNSSLLSDMFPDFASWSDSLPSTRTTSPERVTGQAALLPGGGSLSALTTSASSASSSISLAQSGISSKQVVPLVLPALNTGDFSGPGLPVNENSGPLDQGAVVVEDINRLISAVR